MVRAADSTGGSRPAVQTTPAQAPARRPESIIAAGLSDASPAASPKPAGDTRTALPETVTVKQGDSLSVIAARHHVSLEQIKAHNPELFQDGPDKAGKKRATDGRLIYPGETIKLRAADAKPVDPARTTTASNKVVKAAKDYIDNASILGPEAAGGKGKEVSQRVVDSARKMLTLIPDSDPDRKTYERKVDRIFADFLAQYPSQAPTEQRRLQDASNSFNTALRSYQDSKKVEGQLPAADVRAFQIDTMQRALDAFTEANAALKTLPEGADKVEAQQQLDMMAYALGQMGVPDDLIEGAKTQHVPVPADLPDTDTSGPQEVALNTTAPTPVESILGSSGVEAGGETGTQQTVGALPTGADQATVAGSPTSAPAGTPQPIGAVGQAPGAYAPAVQPVPGQPLPGYPVPGQPVAGYPAPGQPVAGYPVQPYAIGPNGQPLYPAGYAPAVQMPAQPAGPRQYVPGPGEMAMFQAEDVKPITPNYGNGGIEHGTSPTGANGANGADGANGTNGTNGADGTNTDRPQKDPNDPKVKQIWEYLKRADHKAVRDLVGNFDLFYASLPEQKALMIKILLDGRTSGDDQAAMASIVDMARQQGESDKMMAELDRLMGGTGKGLSRMFEDLKKGARQQVLSALFGDPPRGTSFSPTFYNNLVAGLDKKDIEFLCENLGTTPGSEWLNRIPNTAKQGMIAKLKSWWPFSGGLKRMREAIQASMAYTQSAQQPPSA